jgi:hypothetical protein
MNTMLERLGVPSARNARYFAPGVSFHSITPPLATKRSRRNSST